MIWADAATGPHATEEQLATAKDQDLRDAIIATTKCYVGIGCIFNRSADDDHCLANRVLVCGRAIFSR